MNHSTCLQTRSEGGFARIHHEAGEHARAPNAAAGRAALFEALVDALDGENLPRYRRQNTPKGVEA